jgi:uncharacterized protein (DUF2336 family)
MVAAVSPELITQLDAAVKGGASDRSGRILQHVTDLLLSNISAFGESQISVMDDVLARLVGQTDAGALTELSETLCHITLAPRETVRRLALHNDPSVAVPLLRSSNRLAEKDLIEIAKTHGQQHLLAICARKKLSEALTDALMRRGDANVSNALAHNPGANFSECGYATLVGRAERDEGLIEKLGVRLDLPANLLRELLTLATDVVRAKFLTASRPVHQEKRGAAPVKARPKHDYAKILSQLDALNRAGKLNNQAVNRFAVSGEYENVVAALAMKADVKVEVIEPFLESDRLYALIVTCKAARLDWAATQMIVYNRPGCPPVTPHELEQAREIFDHLLLSIAQWTVRFASERM